MIGPFEFECTGRQGQSEDRVKAHLEHHVRFQAVSLRQMWSHEFLLTKVESENDDSDDIVKRAQDESLKALHTKLTRSNQPTASHQRLFVECLRFKVLASMAEHMLHAKDLFHSRLEAAAPIEEGCFEEGAKFKCNIDLEKLHGDLDRIHKKGDFNFDDLNDTNAPRSANMGCRRFHESQSWYMLSLTSLASGLSLSFTTL